MGKWSTATACTGSSATRTEGDDGSGRCAMPPGCRMADRAPNAMSRNDCWSPGRSETHQCDGSETWRWGERELRF